jgi:hypothetical protein
MAQVTETNAYRRGTGGARKDEAAATPGPTLHDHDLRARQERLLDEGLEETFPASDPVAVMRLT